MKRFFIGWGLLLTVAGLGMAACHRSTPEQELTFVCEDDGGLVERHVGVVRVNDPMYNESPVWALKYMDGRWAYYHQPPGETCYTEPVAEIYR